MPLLLVNLQLALLLYLEKPELMLGSYNYATDHVKNHRKSHFRKIGKDHIKK